MNVESLKVTVMDGIDITNLCTDITLFESINGYVKGSVQVLDGINFYDEVFGILDDLWTIQISFVYEEKECTNDFFINGVHNMKIKKSEKEYVMNLISPVEQALKLYKLNEVYSGTSHEIVGNIFTECTGPASKLIINTPAISKGKYIVPNISARQAIANVVNAAIDADNTGFYFFQRLFEDGVTRLMSLRFMATNFFLSSGGNKIKIYNYIPKAGNPHINNQGSCNTFIQDEYKMNYIEKLAQGNWGNKIHHVLLDKTKVIKNEPIEQTINEITQYKISDKLYDINEIADGPAGKITRYQQKSLFSNIYEPNDVASINMKKRLLNVVLKAKKIVPIGGVGCGLSINVEMGEGDKSRAIGDGNYVIADINHIFSWEGNGYNYQQDMTLIREMA